MTNEAYLSIKIGKDICRLELIHVAKKDTMYYKGNGLWSTFEFHSRVVMVDKKARILPPFIIYVSPVPKNISENALK